MPASAMTNFKSSPGSKSRSNFYSHISTNSQLMSCEEPPPLNSVRMKPRTKKLLRQLFVFLSVFVLAPILCHLSGRIVVERDATQEATVGIIERNGFPIWFKENASGFSVVDGWHFHRLLLNVACWEVLVLGVLIAWLAWDRTKHKSQWPVRKCPNCQSILKYLKAGGCRADGARWDGLEIHCSSCGKVELDDPFRPENDAEPMAVYSEIDGWVKCPNCSVRFSIKEERSFSFGRHRCCGQRLIPESLPSFKIGDRCLKFDSGSCRG